MAKQIFNIMGCLETGLPAEEWLDEFIGWIESRGEVFAGHLQERNEKK